MNLLLPPKDVMLSYASEIDQICNPLRSYGITYVGMVRLYKNNERFDLNNRPDHCEYYYYQSDCYQKYPIELFAHDLPTGFSLGDALGANEATIIARENFNINNILVLIEHYQKYTEVWHFASENDNKNIINIYIENMQYLRRFTWYFKEKAEHIIDMNENSKNKITKPLCISKKIYAHSNNMLQKLSLKNLSLPIDRFILDDKNKISKREIECAKWCFRGKNAEEIGLILGVSKKTAEAHLNNLKQKLNCYKQTQLIYKLTQLGLIDINDPHLK